MFHVTLFRCKVPSLFFSCCPCVLLIVSVYLIHRSVVNIRPQIPLAAELPLICKMSKDLSVISLLLWDRSDSTGPGQLQMHQSEYVTWCKPTNFTLPLISGFIIANIFILPPTEIKFTELIIVSMQGEFIYVVIH